MSTFLARRHALGVFLTPQAAAGLIWGDRRRRSAARSAAGALVIWLDDEGVLREGVVVELLDAHRVSDLTLAVDGSVDDRRLRIGAADGVDNVGARVEVDEVDELDLEELGRVELRDDHGPALGLLRVRLDHGDAVDHRVLRGERHDAAARDGGPPTVLRRVELEDDERVERRVVEQAGAQREEQVHRAVTGGLELGGVDVDGVEANRPRGLAEVVHREAWVVGPGELVRLELDQGRGRAEERAPDGAVGGAGDAWAGDEALLLRGREGDLDLRLGALPFDALVDAQDVRGGVLCDPDRRRLVDGQHRWRLLALVERAAVSLLFEIVVRNLQMPHGPRVRGRALVAVKLVVVCELLERVLDRAAVALHGLGDLARTRGDAGEAGLDGARIAVPLLVLLALALRLAGLQPGLADVDGHRVETRAARDGALEADPDLAGLLGILANHVWPADVAPVLELHGHLVLVEDRWRSVRVEVLDVDQQQGVRVLERQPQAARAVGERDVVQPGVDLGTRLLAVDVHLVIEDLAYAPEGLLILQQPRLGVDLDPREHRVRHLAHVDRARLSLEDHLVRLVSCAQLHLLDPNRLLLPDAGLHLRKLARDGRVRGGLRRGGLL
mmetsp:Transcript_11382/g.28497  ORF Transcript_11382/g.28497 Transcript_11382/m.28497 type:complete len:613 (-) Transcript_11382:99-1937(-)